MSSKNYAQAFKLVLRYEGGYVNNPRDPGGPTNLGITQQTLSAWLGRQATIADVKALTPAKVMPIYKKQYWDHISGDDLPDGVDYAVFDYAVNSGVSKAAKDLQAVIGETVDGHIGLNTVETLRGLDPAVVIGQLCDRRLSFMKRLKTWRTFGRGWSDRVRGVRSIALQMSRKLGQEPFMAAGLLDMSSARADPTDESMMSMGAGQAGGLAGLGAVGGVVTQAADQVSSLSYYIDSLKWVFIALTVIGIGITLYITYKQAKSND